MRRFAILASIVALFVGLLAVPQNLVSRGAVGPDFVHFESSHVRPAVMTPSGDRLLVVNTADNRLSVFDLTGAAPARVAEIPVGLEPTSVAVLDESTAWVVNYLSDDISIVDLDVMHVRATLRVGDEPGDVVFAGAPLRAYVSVGDEDVVKVYDPADLAVAPIVIPIDGRGPRALARNDDGSLVYVSVFHAGNRTSVLAESDVPNDSLPVDPSFPRNPAIPTPPPQTGLIVQESPDGEWRDMYGKLWNYRIKYSMHEVDVAEINTASNTVVREFGDLGAVNFGLDVNATNGEIAVSSTEARNLVRFEPRLRGHIVDTQIGLVSSGGATALRNLNPHVDYTTLPGTQAERDSALGIPTALAYSSNGQRLYVTSFASDKLGVVDPASGFAGGILARVATVAGPTGVVEDAARERLYVVGRFRNQLQTLSANDFSEIAVAGLGFDPTPDVIVNGRKFFYGGFTSAHGDQACATCHVFGDFDNIAWDLGDPGGDYAPAPPGMIDPFLEGFDPEKGPMATQTLRGLNGTGLLHWRGDREDLNAFNPAFVSLMGRTDALPDSEMAAFNEFVTALVYPPNPTMHLDRTMPNAPAGQPSALRGQDFFLNTPAAGPLTCNNCHTVPTGTNGQIINDAALQEDQDIKVPQLRNMYKKTGFVDQPGAVNKRGFAFIHDGTVDNLFNFLQFSGFNFPGGDDQRRDVEAFLLSFDTGMAPAVGYQITFDGTNHTATALARLDTLKAQALSGNCDLIAKGRVDGKPRGWIYVSGEVWMTDMQDPGFTGTAVLLNGAGAGSEVTFTGVPAGSGERMGIDRDRDTFRDGDELNAGTDPGDPASTPMVAVGTSRPRGFALRSVYPNPFRGSMEIAFTLGTPGRVDASVFDVAGREVRSIARGAFFAAGQRTLRWDGRRRDGSAAEAGVYFVRLTTDGGTWTRAVTRVR